MLTSDIGDHKSTSFVESYTHSMSLRPAHISARRWVVGMKDKHNSNVIFNDPKSHSADDIAESLMHGFKALDVSGRDRIRPQLENDPEGFISSSVKGMLRRVPNVTKEFRESVFSALDAKGYAEWKESVLKATTPCSEETEKHPIAQVENPKEEKKTFTMATLRHVNRVLGFGPDSMARHFSDMDEEEVKQLIPCFQKTGNLPWSSRQQREKQEEQPFNVLCCTLTMVQVRTCFLDDVLQQSVEEYSDKGCSVVILGAGDDTRFYRIPLPDSVACIEVDSEKSQLAKLEKLKSIDLNKVQQKRVQYVSCEKETKYWLECLEANGLQQDLPLIVIWEGGSYYLEKDVFENVLEKISTFRAPAAIAFDYFSPRLLACERSPGDRPWIFGAEPEEMTEILKRKNLHILDHPENKELLHRYLPVKPNGQSVGVIGSHRFLVMASNSRWELPQMDKVPLG